MMLNSGRIRKKKTPGGFPFKHTDSNARIRARTQRSMISETNIMIGFDTLSESDTRREERAYRLAQLGAKELVKHELFPAEH